MISINFLYTGVDALHIWCCVYPSLCPTHSNISDNIISTSEKGVFLCILLLWGKRRERSMPGYLVCQRWEESQGNKILVFSWLCWRTFVERDTAARTIRVALDKDWSSPLRVFSEKAWHAVWKFAFSLLTEVLTTLWSQLWCLIDF